MGGFTVTEIENDPRAKTVEPSSPKPRKNKGQIKSFVEENNKQPNAKQDKVQTRVLVPGTRFAAGRRT